ncbi:lipopolysaccharide-induced tumor necrosis factor-alpha factor-like [Tropilaelaps mercedesae]|uniref:Lipopolysaccharide-induced tumor necrosis factor-alpha factor-like n=1 Tax=Tropilaelaps mercedesae TaxID=418985 RepID=A0A1V9WY38_9ACAR|nr:lipopolysaccharide-induced tumor necrosis factor-alpha factor-like [Tropilaelaps mercedesae]
MDKKPRSDKSAYQAHKAPYPLIPPVVASDPACPPRQLVTRNAGEKSSPTADAAIASEKPLCLPSLAIAPEKPLTTPGAAGTSQEPLPPLGAVSTPGKPPLSPDNPEKVPPSRDAAIEPEKVPPCAAKSPETLQSTPWETASVLETSMPAQQLLSPLCAVAPTKTGELGTCEGYTPGRGNLVPISSSVRFGDQPMNVICSNCHQRVTSVISYETGAFTYICAFGLALFVWCGCCLIPCCIDSCKDVHHICPSCKAQLGIFKRI